MTRTQIPTCVLDEVDMRIWFQCGRSGVELAGKADIQPVRRYGCTYYCANLLWDDVLIDFLRVMVRLSRWDACDFGSVPRQESRTLL